MDADASPWTQAIVPYTPVTEVVVRDAQPDGRWAALRSSFASPTPGRTLNQVYCSVGGAVERRTNRLAYRMGLGPHVPAEKIKSAFGDGEQRCLQLCAMRDEVPASLERECSRLIKYTLPAKAATTQLQAWKSVVELATLFPGLRSVFLHSKRIADVPPTLDGISALWDRSGGGGGIRVGDEIEWSFWKTLAATCLSDTSISAVVEQSTVPQLTHCELEDGGLSVIERLLVALDCRESEFSDSLCVRYLGGVLSLPGFWLDSGRAHGEVAKKLCLAAIRVLKDIGADLIQPPVPVPDDTSSPFDYEGTDLLIDTLLHGISCHFTIAEDLWHIQPWFSSFAEVVQLLRGPTSEELLPNSWTRATSERFNMLIPALYRDVEMNIRVEPATNVLREQARRALAERNIRGKEASNLLYWNVGGKILYWPTPRAQSENKGVVR
ncbi:hypothetical protein GGX14DRAFT_465941 [Mycena pura]|uniref:Uncharacterized protein n=1 Tax=Mycena pura TaxID=153505 RepID=A0AAD6YBR3_9AGAR|nr:hypothetical protein GGX14DRAFT_465941 [Mycena pura]